MAALPEAGLQQAASPGQPEPPEAADKAPPPGTGPVAGFAHRLRAEGLPDETIAYIQARGLLFERRLAAIAATQAEFVEVVVQPFLTGFEVAGVLHRSQQDPALARAFFVIAWQMAHEAARAGTATPALPAPAAPSGGAAPHAGGFPCTGAVCSFPGRVAADRAVRVEVDPAPRLPPEAPDRGRGRPRSPPS